MLTSVQQMLEQEDRGDLRTLDPKLQKKSDELFEIFQEHKSASYATGGDTGWQTSDISRRNRLIAEIVYIQSSLISAHLEVTPRIPTTELEVQWDFGTKFEGELDVPEGYTADLKRSEWFPRRFKLKKYEIAFYYTWEQMIYDKDGFHMQNNLMVASDDMAEKVDNDGLNQYYIYKGNSIAANHAWDDLDSTEITASIDIGKVKNWIMENSNINRAEIKNLALVYPAGCSGLFETLRSINGMNTNLQNYFNSLGIQLLESRSPTLYATAGDYGARNTAIMLVKGRNTARFYDFTGYPPVPLTQRMEHETGHKYIIRRWFGTKVIPLSVDSSVNTSDRVVLLTGVHT